MSDKIGYLIISGDMKVYSSSTVSDARLFMGKYKKLYPYANLKLYRVSIVSECNGKEKEYLPYEVN